MALKLLERLPLPSLWTYIALSVLTSGLALYHAHRTVTQNHINRYFNGENRSSQDIEHMYEDYSPELKNAILKFLWDEHWQDMLSMMRFGTLHGWTLINSYFCLLILVEKLTEKVVFGELRFVEQRLLRDKFWNFAFSKFLIIFGVLKLQSLREVVFWTRWFSFLCLLYVLTQLSQARSTHLMYSLTTPRSDHVKLLSLLAVILLLCRDSFHSVVNLPSEHNSTIYRLMATEVLLVMLKSVYAIVHYVVLLCYKKLQREPERYVYLDYADVAFEFVILNLDVVHHFYMLTDSLVGIDLTPFSVK